mmetsp:Transcript_16492/g.19038  ORF Transcript_16492/g.19038 Transcript_16492/m.19038 type:complete len:113 (+) Transcript_16492:176-514(+)
MNFSEDIIRRVEEEMAYARKAAQEATRSPTTTEDQSCIGGSSNIRNGRINRSINRLIDKSNRINGNENSSGSQNNPGDWRGEKRGWRKRPGRQERSERSERERERELERTRT